MRAEPAVAKEREKRSDDRRSARPVVVKQSKKRLAGRGESTPCWPCETGWNALLLEDLRLPIQELAKQLQEVRDSL